jgi:mannose-6-phosphate isomerase-like protein (cupin superfamily)
MPTTTADHRSLVAVHQHPSGSCTTVGTVQAAPADPPGRPLWCYRVRLAGGAGILWTGDHEDEVIFVLEGRLLGGDTLAAGPRCAVVVEAGVAYELHADGDTELLHFGGTGPPEVGPLGPPESDQRSAYVIDPSETFGQTVVTDGANATVTFWADSTRSTTRLALFEVVTDRGHRTPSHTHSQDEIIVVIDGELHVGPTVVAGGTSITIPGDFRYGFVAPESYRFFNFRRDSSLVVFKPGDTPQVEIADTARIVDLLMS